MKKYRNYIIASLILLVLSFFMFLIHYLIFGQLENTIYYSLMNLCFIPINILAVTLVFENLLDKRAKEERINKLNMLVGLFFGEMGYCLMSLIIESDEKTKNLVVDFSDLKVVETKIKNHKHTLDFEKLDVDTLTQLLIKNKDLLINLISNENILEHETFTDLLMAVSHLRDEVIFRNGQALTKDDCLHLQTDVIRVYDAITIQWVHYLAHLKKFYPYLYTSAIQVNPFNSRICFL